MTDNIKIIVRVRPFIEREEGQDNIVQMDDQQVRLTNPDDRQIRKFAFHRCYWSTDDSQGRPPVDNTFVFNDIGKQILSHIYQGYSSTVFAYGQTGAGKSYSIEGYEEKGILQMCLEDIFMNKKIENDKEGITTSIRVTYLQIYNEKLRDLLNPSNTQEIKVQSAGNAVFISGVNPVLCESYDEVLKMFQDGKKIRVIGAHAMNKNSSRSHAVFTIYYKEAGKGKMIQSKFNIVDLAGSERQSKTGATGKRLEEANNINKSLTNLGIVIEALAANCAKKDNNKFVPYRNSVLTHILSESLAGNSKTFMIAAISPASSNYEETLSTLRFAQRASMITTKTKKNVEQKGGYNKELLEEIERLKGQLQSAQGKNTHTHSHSVSVEYITVEDRKRAEDLESRIRILMEELQNNKAAMEDLEKQLEEERKRKLKMDENRKKALKEAGLSTEAENQAQKSKLPYIMNISEDPTLAGMLIYHLKQGEIKIGTNEAEENDIKLNALGIMKRHCILHHENGDVYIEPIQDCKLFVNGLTVHQKIKLRHLDRITLGHANTFKLIMPGQKGELYQSLSRYGEFLDDRLNSNSIQAKNTKVFLQELQQRLDKSTFAKFLDKFKNTYDDIDEANDYTAFRYKKYPLKSKNIHFRVNVIIDIHNYIKGQPSLIILCEHKETKEVVFIWSEEKFQARLAEMQSWYADVSNSGQSESTFYEFDPWFDASDNFIKEKEKLQLMNSIQLHEFWSKKQNENTQVYKQLLLEQKEVLENLKKSGGNAEIVEDYADYYFRSYDILEKNKGKVQAFRKNEQFHNLVKRFMQICAQLQKCNLDNKAFNTNKKKYGNQERKEEKRESKKEQKENTNPQGLVQENAWMSQKIEELSTELKRKTKQIHDLRKVK